MYFRLPTPVSPPGKVLYTDGGGAQVKTVIETQALRKAYDGVEVLHPITLKVEPHSIVGFLAQRGGQEHDDQVPAGTDQAHVRRGPALGTTARATLRFVASFLQAPFPGVADPLQVRRQRPQSPGTFGIDSLRNRLHGSPIVGQPPPTGPFLRLVAILRVGALSTLVFTRLPRSGFGPVPPYGALPLLGYRRLDDPLPGHRRTAL